MGWKRRIGNEKEREAVRKKYRVHNIKSHKKRNKKLKETTKK